MPGISLICDLRENLLNRSDLILSTMDEMIYDDRYKNQTLLQEKQLFIGCTAYEDYPITCFKSDDYIIYLEGKIYNIENDCLEKELYILADRISASDSAHKIQVSEWLLSTDGDFIIFIFHKNHNTMYVLNDVMSRLPLYYSICNDQIIISRDMHFITSLIDDINFDKMAIAQTLLFGYSIGNRTLLDNVNWLEPSSLFSINFDTSEIKKDSIHQFNFQIKNNSNKTIKTNAIELVSLFSEACRSRANSSNGNKNILSLSGGLDSRSVAAGLSKENCEYSTVTRLSHDRRESADAKLAEHLANVFDVDWKEIYSGPPKGKDLLTLLKIKSGMNSLGMRVMIPYFNNILDQFGSKINFFTGDGGDKLFPDLRPYKNLSNIDELIHYIISNNQIYPIDMVTDLTQVNKDDILSELRNHLLSYPEDNVNYKYVHFTIFERGFKWLFEGEDRNRFYFWSNTPFYSTTFFNYAIHCPDTQKSNYKLYREFLLNLSHKAAIITNKDWNASILSKKASYILFVQSLKMRIPREFKNLIRKYGLKNEQRYQPDSTVMDCFKYQLANCNKIYHCFSEDKINTSINNLNAIQFNILFTLTSIIEKIADKRSVLEKYAESDFI